MKSSAKTKSSRKKGQAEPLVRLHTTPEHNLSQKELSALAAARVTIEMALERLEKEFPSLWVHEIELFPCGPNCRECRAGA